MHKTLESLEDNKMTDKRLLEMAAEVMNNSYSPYSMTKIGAAIECTDGTVYTGCVIENIAIGSTICAETAAIASAVSAGQRTFKRIAIISEGTAYRLPCGHCRQILNEFSPNIEVLCARASDGRFVSYNLSALLPLPLVAGNE
jgi:cytidine deaminase